jgi:DNA-binding winged helix-turn-helix (wHTH) protein
MPGLRSTLPASLVAATSPSGEASSSSRNRISNKLTPDFGSTGMDEPEDKIVDVFMCKLRKKLAGASGGKEFIETIWARGYLLREPTDEMKIPA